MKHNIANKVIYWDRVQCDAEISQTIYENDDYQEAIGRLLLGEYKALNLEKLHNYDDIYSVRVKGRNKADRLLFTKGDRKVSILSVADNHDYDTALKEANRKLRRIHEIDFIDAANDAYEIEPHDADLLDDYLLNEDDLFGQAVHYNKRVITLSEHQKEITLPIMINGIAGSGKTLVAQDVLMSVEDEEDEVSYYFAPTQDLVKTMRASIQALPQGNDFIAQGKVVITTFEDYARTQLDQYDTQHQEKPKEVVGFDAFKEWYNNPKELNSDAFTKNKLKDYSPEQIYSEICRASTYSREDYKDNLGNRESLFAGSKTVANKAFNIMGLYLTALDAGKVFSNPESGEKVHKKLFDPNMMPMPAPDEVKTVGIRRFDDWFEKRAKSAEEVEHKKLLNPQRLYGLVSSARINEEDTPVKSQEDEEFFAKLSPAKQAVIFKVREDYLQDLADNNLQDPVVTRIFPKQKTVIVDEFQSTSPRLLKIAKDLSGRQESVMYAGDIAQSVQTSISNIGVVKKLFDGKISEETWVNSYRCPSKVMTAASKLLELKQMWTGEKEVGKAAVADKEKGEEAEEREGQCYFYPGPVAVNAIADTIKENDPQDIVIIVPDDKLRDEAREKFGKGEAVTPKEVIGMEYNHAVMYRCFEKKAPKNLMAQNGQEAQEEEKTAISELFVAMTRELSSLTICETTPHKNEALFEALKLQDLNLASQVDKPAVNTFAALENETEEELLARREALISRVHKHIEKGNEVVAYNMLLQDIYKGDAAQAKAHLAELKGENVPQEKESAPQEFEEIKLNKGHQRTRQRGRRDTNEGSSQQGGTVVVNNANPIRNRVIQQAQNDKGWFTSRASQALVGFLAVAAASAGAYFSGRFGGGNTTINVDVDQFRDKFHEWDCGNIASHNCDVTVFEAAQDKNNARRGLNVLQEFGRLGFDFTKSLTPKGDTAAHVAAISGNVAAMRLLNDYVDLGSLKDNIGFKPISHAESKNQLGIFKELVKLGYDFTDDVTPLISAIKHSHTEIVNLLVNHVNLDLLGKEGYAPAQVAIFKNNPELLQSVIKAGANLNIRSKDDLGLVDVAVLNDVYNPKIFEILKNNGVNFHTPGSDGRLPIHRAAATGKSESFMMLAKDNESSLLKKDIYGKTPVDLGHQSGNPDILKFFSDRKLNPGDTAEKVASRKAKNAPTTTPTTANMKQKKLSKDRDKQAPGDGYYHRK